MGKDEDEDGMSSNDLYSTTEIPRFGVSGTGGLIGVSEPSPFQRGDPLRVSSRKYKKPPPGRVSVDATTASTTTNTTTNATTLGTSCGSAVSEENAIREWEEDVQEEYYETNCNIMQKLDDLRKSMEDLSASHEETFDRLGEEKMAINFENEI